MRGTVFCALILLAIVPPVVWASNSRNRFKASKERVPSSSPNPSRRRTSGTAVADLGKNGTDEIVYAQAVWRHGDRTPVATLIGDLEHGEDMYPEGLGQLTQLGMQQQFRLGRRLRNRYINKLHLVGQSYDSSQIYVRSSDTDRTLMSATANMVGFYSKDNVVPADNYEDWPTGYVPVPIHNIPSKMDYITGGLYTPCDRRKKLDELLLNTPDFERLKRRSNGLIDEFARHSGENAHLNNLWRFLDVLEIKEKYGQPLPTWYTEDMKARLKQTQYDIYQFAFGIDVEPHKGVDFAVEIPKIRGGPLLWEMINHMTEWITCDEKLNNLTTEAEMDPKERKNCQTISKRKYYAYSMHDMTLKALAQVLRMKYMEGFSQVNNPPYATAVTLELWRRQRSRRHSNSRMHRSRNRVDFNPLATPNHVYFVKLLLWRPEKEESEDITHRIFGCDDKAILTESGCPLQVFMQYARTYEPKPNIKELCKNLNVAEPESFIGRLQTKASNLSLRN